MTYKELALKYIDTLEEVKEIDSEIDYLEEEGEAVPESLRASHKAKVEEYKELIGIANDEYSKCPEQLAQDGWSYWYKEDAILRELRYGF